MSYLANVEQRIAEAIGAGAFEGLEGEGQPIDLSRGELAGEAWLGHHMLENGQLLPPWLQLARDIELRLSKLELLDVRHAALVREFQETQSEALVARIEGVRSEFASLARSIRNQQDQFNIDAPGRLSERPGLWVEHLLERLDARLATGEQLP